MGVRNDPDVQATVWWIIMFTCVFQSFHNLPLRAVEWLLKFLATLLNFFGSFSPHIAYIATIFPGTLQLREKYLANDFYCPITTNYVVCQTCLTLYTYEHSIMKDNGRIHSKKCTVCTSSTVLLREVITREGTKRFYPYLVYPYCSLISSLRMLFSRPDFVTLCERNRSCNIIDNTLHDIHDGEIWTSILSSGKPFLSLSHNYALLLNVDWFQPYKHRTYSVGVIYVAILNLPRDICYKRENMIIVGIIQGPHEPSKTINTYLKPLVDDLLVLWKGIDITLNSGAVTKCRFALICCSCDLPAGRKVVGFLSHSANLGCSRCYCKFSTGKFGVQDYSGFDRCNWQLRSNDQHRKDVQDINKCTTKTKRQEMESLRGCRYSSLLELPYFDPVKMLTIDPMHNLYIGTAKYMFKLWLKLNLLSNDAVTIINARLATFSTSGISHLPRIDNSKYTAEQWMLWTNYYSLVCLHGLLQFQHIECWRHFVLASRLLSNSI